MLKERFETVKTFYPRITLSTEVQVAWNSRSEFSPEAQDLIKESVASFFENVWTALFVSSEKVLEGLSAAQFMHI